MYHHYLVFYQATKPLRRIAYIISHNRPIDIKTDVPKPLQNLIKNYKVRIYNLTTNSIDPKSIKEEDPYFEDVTFYTHFSDFEHQLLTFEKENVSHY